MTVGRAVTSAAEAEAVTGSVTNCNSIFAEATFDGMSPLFFPSAASIRPFFVGDEVTTRQGKHSYVLPVAEIGTLPGR